MGSNLAVQKEPSVMRKKLSNILVSGEATDAESRVLHLQNIEDRSRCRSRIGVSAQDVAKMVNDYVASRGGITQCPAAFAALSRQYGL
jgi:hypothetical protein